MKRVIILIFSLLNAFAQQPVLSQTVQSTQEEAARQRQLAEEQTQNRNRRNGYNEQGFMTELGPPLSRELYKGRKKEIENLRKAYEKTKNMLVVPKNYFEQYKFLLKDKKVKLARLQPDKNCYSKNIISAEELERCTGIVPVPGGGSLYSFKSQLNRLSTFDVEYQLKFNAERDWWNIHFINDKFVVQNDSVRGIIAEIGDADLKNINSSSIEIEFLNAFKQKKTLPEVKEQSEDLRKGISFNNVVYSNLSPVQLNSTYVLRSIDYRSLRENPPSKRRGRIDKRADITVAFKVVGQENDGSVIILWKELKAARIPE